MSLNRLSALIVRCVLLSLLIVLLFSLIAPAASAPVSFAVCPTFPHTVPAGDVNDLINAINCANSNGANTDDVIHLTNSTYTLTSESDTGGSGGFACLPSPASTSTAGTLTIDGHGATLTPEQSPLIACHAFYVPGLSNLTLKNMTLTGFDYRTRGAGGALFNDGTILLDTVVFTNNKAFHGASIFNVNTQVIVNSTFSGNLATGTAGAVAGSFSSPTKTTIINSTFSGNTATSSGGALSDGGAALVIINSTFSGNSGSSGGAIYLFGSNMYAINSTFSGNSAPTSARTLLITGGADSFLYNTILANGGGAAGAECSKDGISTATVHYSLIEDASCGVSDNDANHNRAVDPNLGTLTGNPAYLPLMSGSPARDAGSNGFLSEATLNLDMNGDGDKTDTVTTDQLDNARIANITVDMGSYEYFTAPLTVQLALQGRTNAAPHSSYVVTVHGVLMPQGGGAALLTQDFVTNTNGVFTIPGLAAGSYLLRVKGTHTLAREYEVSIDAATNSATPPALLEGDANDDNSVTIGDFSILTATFGKALGQAGYDGRADFNGDNAVTIADFSLLAANFGKIGDGVVIP